MVEQGDHWFQAETYLSKIARIMATIVEIRQGLSEDSSLHLKTNLALERLGQLANGEIKVEGNKVKVGELRPWFLSDTPRQAAIRELYEDHEWAYREMRSEFPADVWATLKACSFAEFLVEHPQALALRTQRIEREMADHQRRLKDDVSKQGDDPSHE
jgi:hypothetical protein